MTRDSRFSRNEGEESERRDGLPPDVLLDDSVRAANLALEAFPAPLSAVARFWLEEGAPSTCDLDALFFDAVPSEVWLAEELEFLDPRALRTMTEGAAGRRAHFARYVAGVVAVSAALCAAALVKVSATGTEHWASVAAAPVTQPLATEDESVAERRATETATAASSGMPVAGVDAGVDKVTQPSSVR